MDRSSRPATRLDATCQAVAIRPAITMHWIWLVFS